MARVCVFDVNETLLDLGALDPHFERVFGEASARQAWFGQFLALWLTEMLTGEYTNFGTIGGGALEMVAKRQGVDLSDEDKQRILGDMQELPPHPEVEDALGRLRDAGIRLAALTNSTQQVADARAVPNGRREPRGRGWTGPARCGPRLGRGRGHACRMRRRLRSEAGDGPEPARG